jgi:hypothetical protein
VHAFTGFNPEKHVRDDGTFTTAFELEQVVRIQAPLPLSFSGFKVTRLATHRKVAVYLEECLEEIANAGLWHTLQAYGGGFNPRLIRGGSAWSMHSFALAHDFDPNANPLGAPPHACTFGNTSEGLAAVRIFTRWGFLWGGYFNGRKDCQHFQWCTGC